MTMGTTERLERPYTLAERLALADEGGVPDGMTSSRATAVRAEFVEHVAALERALAGSEPPLGPAELARERAVARRSVSDRVALRVSVLLQAAALLAARLDAIRVEVERRIELRESEALRVLSSWEEEVGPFVGRDEVARLEAFAAALPEVPSLDGFVGDYAPDPPDPWDPEPESDDYEEFSGTVRSALGISGAVGALTWARTDSATRADLVRWAAGQGLLDQESAVDLIESDQQVRDHLDGYRYDLEFLALASDRRDVANGTLSTQVAWAREEGLMGPRSAYFVLSRSAGDPRFSGT